MADIIKFTQPELSESPEQSDEYEKCCEKLWDLLISFTDDEILKKTNMEEEQIMVSLLTNILASCLQQFYTDKIKRNEAIGVVVSSMITWINESDLMDDTGEI